MVRKQRLAWSDVLRATVRPETRSRLTDHLRTAGFVPDRFAANRESRSVVLEAMVRAEDWLEASHPRWTDSRLAMRDARRRLEAELWP